MTTRIKNMISAANLKKRIIRSEHDEQKEFFRRVQLTRIRDPVFNNVFAIPNGGHRNKIVAAKLKAEGVKPGIPDIFAAIPRFGYHGLFVEMKRTDGGSGVSKEQNDCMADLTLQGYLCSVARGAEEAWEILINYLNI